LVTGVLAGLITSYLRDRGNFDAWAADSKFRGGLNLADLDLIQRRNHILNAGLDILPDSSHRLLSMLALLSEALDYPTLKALNPEENLSVTVRDLEDRGLLQYDVSSKRYDLHPVVRGIAAGRLAKKERESFGQRVVDHFTAKAHNPYQEAETLDDVRDGLHIVRTLLKMDRYEEAFGFFQGDFASALLFNLEAHAETVALLRPFFSQGWHTLPDSVEEDQGSYLAASASIALDQVDETDLSLAASGTALLVGLRGARWAAVISHLNGRAITRYGQNRLATENRCMQLSCELAALAGDKEDMFRTELIRFTHLSTLARISHRLYRN
jgi:hypothetical protein